MAFSNDTREQNCKLVHSYVSNKMFLSTKSKDHIFLDVVDSTNTYLLESQCSSGSSCIAHKQTKGRGRLGKTWNSNEGDSFLYSGLLEFPSQEQAISYTFLSILCALSIVEALHCLSDSIDQPKKNLFIKWPNDVLMENQSTDVWAMGKLAGILLESQTRGDKMRIVMGMGINWQGSIVSVEQNAFSPVSYFDSCQKAPVFFLSFLLDAINKNLRFFYQSEWKVLIQKITNILYKKGRQVRYEHSDYKVLGIANDGALLLVDKDGRQKEVRHVNDNINWKVT